MNEKALIQGNEAVGWGALHAGCEAFFGYPITPQNEITEWFDREFPLRGLVFVQSQSESASIHMLYAAAATGVRVITSTSSPGWGLMQEGMSCLANAELPCVVALVMRGGPGQGTTRHSQMDYHSVTRGGGQGGYKNIILAPWSVQEIYEFMQLGFCLADKWCNPVVLLSDGLLGQMVELLEFKTLDFGPLPEKDWAVRGRKHQKDGLRTPWPFPYGIIKEYARKGVPFLAVEDSQEQMLDDVEFAAAERAAVHFLGMLARHEPKEMGMLFAERVLQEIKALL